MRSRQPHHAPTQTKARFRRVASPESRRKRRIITAVLVILILPVAWFTVRVAIVGFNLFAAQGLASRMQLSGSEFDFDALEKTTGHLQFQIGSALSGTEDPTWRFAESIPFVGENLYGVRMAVEGVEGLSTNTLAPAVKVLADGAGEPGASEQKFNYHALDELAPIVIDASSSIQPAIDKLETVDTTKTLPVLGTVIDRLVDVYSQADDVVQEFGPVMTVASSLIGADGERNYILAFQNNAESTALGGSVASFVQVNANNGVVRTGRKASSATFYNESRPYKAVNVPVDQSALDLYGTFLLDHSNTATSRPDFPTAAQIIRAWWQREITGPVDGVISVDPIALSYMLTATGPITLSTGDVLSSENAVDLLLNDVYFKWDSYAEPEKVDAFFQEASQKIIDKITNGRFNAAAMIKAVLKGVDSGSIMMWSNVPEEQATLDGSRIQGVLPKTNDAASVVGVYYRDTSASKIDYYLNTATTTTSDICVNTTNPSFTTSVELHSDLTAEEAAALPDYVKSAQFGAEKFSTEVFVYGPVGATLGEVSVVGGTEGSTYVMNTSDLGRPVAKFIVFLAPGETSTVTASFAGAEGTYGPLEVRGTPMINTTVNSVEPSCAATTPEQ